MRQSASRTPISISIGLDREVSGLLAVSVAYVRKDGHDFIGWKELAGKYREEPATLNDGRVVQVWRLTSPSKDRLLSADQSGGLLADLQRAGHRCGTTTVSRLAGIRVLHVVEGVRAAAFERNDRRGRAGRDRGFPASLVRSTGHVRTGSERSHQRPGPPAQRSSAHGSDDDVGRRATHRRSWSRPICSTSAASPGRRLRSSTPTRTAQPVLIEPRGTQAALVANAARRPHLATVPLQRSGTCRTVPGRAQCPQRHRRGEHQVVRVRRRNGGGCRRHLPRPAPRDAQRAAQSGSLTADS